MPHCLAALQAIYDRLGVRFDVQLGESFYDPMLASVVADSEEQGHRRGERRRDRRLRRADRGPVHRSASATVPSTTPPPTWRPSSTASRPGTPIRFSTWSTTVRATISSSSSRSPGKWGYDSVDLEHVAFGTILGPDRRPFKTREGDVVGLESLLDEATAEARKVVEENSPELDLEPSGSRSPRSSAWVPSSTPTCAQNRISDYVFDWQKMMAMNGNTATYLQYAYARIQSIFRKGGFIARSDPRPAPGDRAGSPRRARPRRAAAPAARRSSSSPPPSTSRTS